MQGDLGPVQQMELSINLLKNVDFTIGTKHTSQLQECHLTLSIHEKQYGLNNRHRACL